MKNELISFNIDPRENSSSYYSDYEDLQKNLHVFKNKIELLRTMILANPLPMTVWDLDDRLIFANIGYLKLFGSHMSMENFGISNDPVLRDYQTYQEFLEIKKGKIVRFLPTCYNPAEYRQDQPDSTRWIESVGCPILGDSNKVEYILFTYADVTRKIKLRNENKELQIKIDEARITIRNIQSLLKEEKQKIKSDLTTGIKRMMLEHIDQFKESDQITKKDFESVKKAIYDAAGGLYDQLISKGYDLTPAEIRICGLIRIGLSGKEVAASLRVHYSTVHTHIKNIRKKLNLVGSGKNLQKYLMELSRP